MVMNLVGKSGPWLAAGCVLAGRPPHGSSLVPTVYKSFGAKNLQKLTKNDHFVSVYKSLSNLVFCPDLEEYFCIRHLLFDRCYPWKGKLQ